MALDTNNITDISIVLVDPYKRFLQSAYEKLTKNLQETYETF